MACYELALFLRPREVPLRDGLGRIDHRSEGCGRQPDGGPIMRRCRRLQTRRIDDLIAIGETVPALGVLRDAQRQNAEPTRGQPDDPRSRFHSGPLESRIERCPQQRPQLRADPFNGCEPFPPAPVPLVPRQIVDRISAEPPTGLVVAADQHVEFSVVKSGRSCRVRYARPNSNLTIRSFPPNCVTIGTTTAPSLPASVRAWARADPRLAAPVVSATLMSPNNSSRRLISLSTGAIADSW